MCGIFALLNQDIVAGSTDNYIMTQFMRGRGRGPESSKMTRLNPNTLIGFHRLAINGLSPASDQPMIMDDVVLICNGEIYNYRELYELLGIVPTTASDCEVIIHLYRRFGIEHTLQLLDGVFAFVLIDQNIHQDEARVFVARDPYGVRPLYVLSDPILHVYGFASELKQLCDIVNSNTPKYDISHFPPGTYSEYTHSFKVLSRWRPCITNRPYHVMPFTSLFPTATLGEYLDGIRNHLVQAVEKRCLTTERPVACLLSGGLDSSLITALVNEYVVGNGLPRLETYSIGIEGSEDLKYAKEVADYLGTRHTEVTLTEADFCAAIPEVIRAIESYDTTTVRASIGNYLLGKYIRANSDAKVIFNGDGSDELFGGYLYMHCCPDAVEYDRETRRLLRDIHKFDVLRSDKSISSHGLEPRTPFLDRAFTQYVLSIPHLTRFRPNGDKGDAICEKWLLRTAFDKYHYTNHRDEPLLPDSVLWRRKEAFSDGVSGKSRSLYEVLQEYASAAHTDEMGVELSGHLIPETAEQTLYRREFEAVYPGRGNIVPYFWMPKYVEAKDASARTLAIY
jgi:asparagine synthase (glutamine-hydrolysing)